ncbi:CHAT domain-containing protein [Sphaerospermopsis aphanizomenoides BCCUSP55]|uniref:CHAT domain-containing protein n=1 Tax=Sphaerospermopsis aphanizomenoides TaxID=459663 RepID=UPI000B13019A|nr:CHAT domain-containing protein [Sphaerospermopsis aphanizomenoides]MBK1986984.1 CHAT domain-containing protein [Sphaerospermopsis aphanizomenoides BCCUSP55]
MKFSRSFLSIFLSVILVILFFKSVQAQVGNQSDITNPDPQEFVPNQSDITNPDPQEINDNSSNTPGTPIVDRPTFDRNFSELTAEEAVAQIEELQALEYGTQLGIDFFGEITSAEEIGDELSNLSRLTGKNAAVLYVTSLQDKLSLILIPPKPQDKDLLNEENSPKPKNDKSVKTGEIVREYVGEANNSNIQKVAQDFRSKVTNFREKSYFIPAQKLYEWIIKPIEPALQANKINTVIFSLDRGLRTLPIAALYDGNQFLIEKYSVGIIPSFSLTDTRYIPIVKSDILALGISQSTEGQDPLPSVPVEINTVSKELWRSQSQTLLDQESTLENLESLSRKKHFGILHLATHGDFKPGKINNSYIQLWNQKIRIDQLRKLSQELGWSKEPKVEMLVLSACRTAVGSDEAELGFSGLAVQAGVKTVLGSLWYVSDQGSLALMTKFYDELNTIPLRSESLRQAQIAMLKEEVRIADGKLYLSPEKSIPLTPELLNSGNIDLSHPYYWSAFTIIGNWN